MTYYFWLGEEAQLIQDQEDAWYEEMWLEEQQREQDMLRYSEEYD